MESQSRVYKGSDHPYIQFPISTWITCFFTWLSIENEGTIEKFGCISCGPCPRVIIADGTNVVIDQNKFLKKDDPLLRKYSEAGFGPRIRDLDMSLLESEAERRQEESELDLGEDRLCRKFYKTNQKRSGGLFLCTCPHGFILTMHMMRRAEGILSINLTCIIIMDQTQYLI